MKHLSLIILFTCFFYLSVVAQTEKGATMFGISGTVKHKEEDMLNNLSYFSLSTDMGLFARKNLAIEASIPLMYSKAEKGWSGRFAGESRTYINKSIGLASFIRGYLGASSFRFLLEAKGGLHYNSQNYITSLSQRYEPSQQTEINSSDLFATLGGGIGANYFITKRLGLEMLVSYSKAGRVTNEKYRGDDYDLNRDIRYPDGLNLNIGLKFYLPGKE